VFQLVTVPLQATVSRGMEAEADWKALRSTRDPEAATELFVSFAETGLGDPSPPRWQHLLLDSHPTLADRVAMARAWGARDEGK
jgi:STE24 endopeptidase